MIISSGSVEMAARRTAAKVNYSSYGVAVSYGGGAERYRGNGSFMDYLQKKDSSV